MMKTDIPVLFTTYNRLDYTKQSLPRLLESSCGTVFIFDNNSTDGTRDYLVDMKHIHGEKIVLLFSDENVGVSGAMNEFVKVTGRYEYLSKIDNDTIVPTMWQLVLRAEMDESNLDIIQAKHPILKETFPGGNFDEWMKTFEEDSSNKGVYFSHFVGGTAIVFKRSIFNSQSIPDTEWVLGGWREFQRRNPGLRKGFCTGTSVKLLDMNDDGGSRYDDYPEYYVETKRLK